MTTSNMTAARAGKAVAATTRKATIVEQVRDLLASAAVNDELKRKLAYCQAELDRGRDDASLVTRRRDLIAEAGRARR